MTPSFRILSELASRLRNTGLTVTLHQGEKRLTLTLKPAASRKILAALALRAKTRPAAEADATAVGNSS